MPTYLTPGVYIEEVSTGARPIQGAGTSTAAFLGAVPRPTAAADEPVAVNNWSHFLREFGGETPASTPLALAVFGFFANGGRRCFIVPVADGEPLGGAGKRRGLQLLESIDEVAIVAAPGRTDAVSYDALLTHCETMKDRVAILDGPQRQENLTRLLEVAAAPLPRRSRREGEPEAEGTAETGGQRPRQSDRGFGAFYFPWLVVADPFSGEVVTCPPSGHLAGIYARADAERGVHKAPANMEPRGAVNVTQRITQQEQGELNQAGVNCIRFFGQEGIRVWGARTLAAKGSEWTYINVRRLFSMVEESIAQSTRWVVFEPNDRTLWKSIRRDVSAFLLQVWRDGALMGATPEEAFFVQCDEETNPPESVDQGRVVIRVGMAPVKPAEFVVFQIGQTAAGTSLETEGGA